MNMASRCNVALRGLSLLLVAAAVLVLAAPRGADAACKTVTVAKGRVYTHGTVADLFDTPAPVRVASAQSSDAWHPNSPAWFADASNVAFSVQAATMQLARRWGAAQAAGRSPFPAGTTPMISIFWYSQANPMTFTECETPDEAVEHTMELAGLGAGALGEDKQLGAARAFCAHQRTAREEERKDGYIVLKDAVRGEREYIMCRASIKEAFPLLTRTKCVVHVQQQLVGRPKLDIRCGEAYPRYYSWNLNAPGIWPGFKEVKPPAATVTGKFLQLADSVGSTKPLKKARKAKKAKKAAKGATSGAALQPKSGRKTRPKLPPKDDTVEAEPLRKGERELLTKAFQAIAEAESRAGHRLR